MDHTLAVNASALKYYLSLLQPCSVGQSRSHDHTKFQRGEYGKYSPLYAPKAKKINKSGPCKGPVMRRYHKPRITINPILGT